MQECRLVDSTMLRQEYRSRDPRVPVYEFPFGMRSHIMYV
jgi:hypothetical protein